MPREWYSDEGWSDYPNLDEGRWLLNTRRSLAGRKGQAILREVREALLAMPMLERRLIKGGLVKDGEACLVGAWAKYRLGRDGELPEHRRSLDFWAGWLAEIERDGDGGDTRDTVDLAQALGANQYLATLLGAENDDAHFMTPEQRWQWMLEWVESQLVVTP